MQNTSLHSIDIEKNCLSGLLKFPREYFRIDDPITTTDFVFEMNKQIYSVLIRFIKENKEIDNVLIAEQIKNQGYTPQDNNFTVFEYLDSLSLIQITKEAVIPSFKELKKYSICRELEKNAQQIQAEIRKNINSTTEEIVAKVDTVFGSKVDIYNSSANNFVDIFETMESFLNERAADPVLEWGIPSPYPIFNEYFGGYRNGNVYVYASRAKQGKSTLLSDIGYHLSKTTHNKKVIKVLYLDTEMETKDVILRQAAAITGVPFWWLDTGQFVKRDDYKELVAKAMRHLKGDKPNFIHYYVANLEIDRIVSLIRRWYYSQCAIDPNIQPVIVYDYLKLTGEKMSNNQQEYQVMGEKVNKLKEVATQIQAPLLTAIQINRMGVTTNREEIVDDESVIAISDRINWFCSYLGIFRRKSRLELENDGMDNGTHKLITLSARFQGKASQGHSDVIKVNGEYRQNYINYSVNNFKVTEGSSLEKMASADRQYMKDKNDKSLKNNDETDFEGIHLQVASAPAPVSSPVIKQDLTPDSKGDVTYELK